MDDIYRTRAFKGTYTSSNKKTHELTVRIFKRLATFGLALTLDHSGIITGNNDLRDDNLQSSFNMVELKDDKNLVASIINHDPYILKDVLRTTYVVKKGDTLKTIANEFGTTVDQICYLNAMDKSASLYEGGTLIIESIAEKDTLDKQRAALESYFYDYVFKSPVAVLATSPEAKNTHQASYYKSLIFGNPKTPNETDSSSIFGQYIDAYLSYNEGNEPKTDEEKKLYIENLIELADETEYNLNRGGSSPVIIPYEQYISYLENGSIDLQSKVKNM